MSVQDERKALEPRPTLLALAERLHQLTPDDPLPKDALARPARAARSRDEDVGAVLAAHFEDPETARLPEHAGETGRHLLHNGADVPAAATGLALPKGRAEPQDAEAVRLLGLLPCFTRRAAAVLSGLGDAAAQLAWLADPAPEGHRSSVIEALCAQPGPESREWLRERQPDRLGPAYGRQPGVGGGPRVPLAAAARRALTGGVNPSVPGGVYRYG
ncbi:hypothetical protein [Streptacidiphilus melanogenes]|uniref:hypothetical protein n=1 Tax=Streptacidiphilus melanogenes TaxID=411235 RepID=UPI0005A6F168|nr:hypothetical protein [Streptacidiphilus melanogenes]